MEQEIQQRRHLHQDRRQDQRDHRHELDEDVHRRSCRILERIAYRISGDGGLMSIAALSAQLSAFDILLRIVPRAAGIGP